MGKPRIPCRTVFTFIRLWALRSLYARKGRIYNKPKQPSIDKATMFADYGNLYDAFGIYSGYDFHTQNETEIMGLQR